MNEVVANITLPGNTRCQLKHHQQESAFNGQVKCEPLIIFKIKFFGSGYAFIQRRNWITAFRTQSRTGSKKACYRGLKKRITGSHNAVNVSQHKSTRGSFFSLTSQIYSLCNHNGCGICFLKGQLT